MSYQGVTPRAGAVLKPQPTKISDDALVEKRITGLLSQNSPYMQQAETRGLQQANKRGLLSSSMAVGAVEGQRIAAALPIASQDAGLYGQANLQDARYMQQGNLNNQTYSNQSSLADQGYGNQRGLNEQNFGYNTQLTEQQGDINSRLNKEQFGYNSQLNNQAFGHNQQLAAQQGQINTGLQNQMFAINTELNKQGHSFRMDEATLQATLTKDVNDAIANNNLIAATQTAANNVWLDQTIPEPDKPVIIDQLNYILTGQVASNQLSRTFFQPPNPELPSPNIANPPGDEPFFNY